jgi:hypothetical protein
LGPILTFLHFISSHSCQVDNSGREAGSKEWSKSFPALTIVLLWINFSVTLGRDGISDGMMLTPSFTFVYHFIQTLLGWMEGCCILHIMIK